MSTLKVCMRPGTRAMQRHQQGLAIIELTITLPLLLLLMLGTAELCRMFYQYNTLTKAVQSGARYLAANGRSATTGPVSLNATTVQSAKDLVVYGSTRPVSGNQTLLPNLRTTDVTITALPATSSIQVDASYQYAPLIANRLPTFGLGKAPLLAIPLNARVSMRVL